MIGARSFLFNLLFYFWTGLIVFLCVPLLAAPRQTLFTAGRIWARGNLFMLRHICALSYTVRGLENLPDEPCIIASKHQSAWDTVIFSTFLNGPGFVLKRELLKIPLFGWYVVGAGCIPIDRVGGPSALRGMIEYTRKILSQGQTVVIFPEGTRTAPGTHLPYHPGTAALYAHLGVPVVPVALNSGLFWGRRNFLKKPGRITLEILPAIAPGMPRKAFAAELEKRIETASNNLLPKADSVPKELAKTAQGVHDPNRDSC